MNWTVIIDLSVSKQIKKFPKNDSERIRIILREMERSPYEGDIEKIDREEIWRRRTGNYRIFYEIKIVSKIVHVFQVKRRTSTTYK